MGDASLSVSTFLNGLVLCNWLDSKINIALFIFKLHNQDDKGQYTSGYISYHER